MKEIKIKCPECNVITTYHRDNLVFYMRFSAFLTMAFAIGWLIGWYS